MENEDLQLKIIDPSSIESFPRDPIEATDDSLNKARCCIRLQPATIGIFLFIFCVSIAISVGVSVITLTSSKSSTTCNMTLRRINKSSLSFSSEPRSIAIGNFNHDSYLDFAVANYGTDTISIFMGKANNTFTTDQTKYSTGIASRPCCITVADFNNDNETDIAVGNYGTNSIIIFFGDGTGLFDRQTVIFTDSSRPVFIATDDINHDRMADIVVVNNGTNSVSIFLGNGDGTFKKAIIHPTGYDSLPYAVAVGNFDGDGFLDIAVANYGTNDIDIVLGYTNNLFTTSVMLSTGYDSHPSSIAIGDFNHDTRSDIVVANYGSGNIAVFLGHGNGTFGAVMKYSLESNSHPQFLTTGFVDQDEHMDVVVVDSQNDRIHILLGYGNGSFNELTTYDSIQESRPTYAIVADFDGDNQSEIVVVQTDAHEIFLLTGYFSRPSVRQAKYSIARDSRPSSLVLYDFNRDGHLDLAVNNLINDYILIFDGTDDGHFVRGQTYTTTQKSGPRYLCLGDLNHDTVMDIIVANGASSSIGILFGQENGTFSDIVLVSTGIGSTPRFIAVSDINNDNASDLISANYGTENIAIFLGYGNGTFTEMITYSTGISSRPISLAIADINHDSYDDIVVSVQVPPGVTVFIGYGNGSFENIANYSFDTNAQPFWTVLADLDSDNDLDLVIVDNYLGIIIFLGNGDGTFRRHKNYSTGSGVLPYKVVVIDVNHDGYHDLVVTNTGSSEIYILFGNGDGTFDSTKIYPTGPGTHPYGLDLVDLDNDTKLDIVVTFWGKGEVAVLTDYFAAEFAHMISYETGSAPHPTSVAIGDLNEDSQLDIVVANSGIDNIEIHFGSGNGTFNKTIIYSLDSDSSPHYTIVIDVNNDDHLDLIVVNTMLNTISIITGYGNGSFSKQAIYPTGDASHPSAIATGYFNKDHRLDLVIANTNADNIGIYFGYNYSSFHNQKAYSDTRILGPSSIVVDDFNNDSYLDIAATFASSDHLGILLGHGDGNFSDMIIYSMSPGSYPNSLAVDDINNDGNKDIMIANYDSNNIGILFGYGNGSFAPLITLSTGGAYNPRFITVGDFNNDQRTDIVLVESGQYTVNVYLGDGNGSFVRAMTYSIGSSSNPYAAATGDFNNDSRLDIAVANPDSSSIYIFLGYGNGSFAAPVKYSTSYRSTPSCIAIADFNGDNRSDIAITTFGGNTVDVLLGYGNGSFGTVASYSTGDGSVPLYLQAGDFNNDEILDIAVANSLSNSIVVLFGLGDGTFLAGKPYSTGVGSSPSSLAIGDFNRDTRLDVVVTNSKSHNIGVFLGYDYEPFSVATQYKTGDNSKPYSVGVADFNHDGHADIAVTNYAADSIGIFLGYGNGTFSSMMIYLTGTSSEPFSLVIHDFNNDNHSDIAVTNSRSNTFLIFLGHGNGTFFLQANYSTGDRSNPYTITVGDMNNDYQSDLIIAYYGTNSIAVFYGYGNGSFENQSVYPLNYNYNPYSVAVADFNQDKRLDAVVACHDSTMIEIFIRMC